MKHYKTVVEEHQRLESVTCDCCGKPWGTGRLEVNEVEICHREGTACEGDSWGQALDLDLCPACFKTKLLPAIRELGITREYESYDYTMSLSLISPTLAVFRRGRVE